MSRKPKFKPVVTRIKLNPEQAVLSCSCYNTGNYPMNAGTQTTFVGISSASCQALNVKGGMQAYVCQPMPDVTPCFMQFAPNVASS